MKIKSLNAFPQITKSIVQGAGVLYIYGLLMVFLSALPMVAHAQEASGAERMRIIMDTDARAEVDDQNAIAYMLFSGNHFEVEGITVNRGSDGPHRTDRRQTIDDHFKEAVDVVRLCDSWGKFPVIKGPAGNYSQIKGDIEKPAFDGSDAVSFIIERAHAPSDRPLIIFSIGNLTIPALALLKDPTIAPKIEIWWLGTQWPTNRGENNQVGDIDATDALLADPNNVTFNIIPYMSFRPPGAAGVTFAEMIEHFTGRGPQVSPAVNTRLGSFTCFGDFSVELFNRGVGSRQKANGRTLLDMVAATALKNNVGKFTPHEMGAPSFVYEKESATGSESPGWPGRWVENSSNPRRVTIWRNPDRDAVWNDIFNTMDNPVLPRQPPAASTPRGATFVDGRAAGSASAVRAGKAPLKLLFDTDIGADIDDEMTLIYLLNSLEIDLRGVTTVFGDPFRRAEFARGLIASMGRGGTITVHPGARVAMRKAPDERTDAVKFIVQSILETDGPCHILVAGAESNVAMALREEPALAKRLQGITLMGYKFDTLSAPFNVNGDLDAADILLKSGIPLRVLPVETGIACQMRLEEYNRLLASECPQMKYIREPMERWVKHARQRPHNPIPDYLPRPYDVLAAMTLTHPGLFEWKRGMIELIDLTPGAGRREGNVRFRESADGLHEIVVGVDRDKAMALLAERLLASPLGSRPSFDTGTSSRKDPQNENK